MIAVKRDTVLGLKLIIAHFATGQDWRAFLMNLQLFDALRLPDNFLLSWSRLHYFHFFLVKHDVNKVVSELVSNVAFVDRFSAAAKRFWISVQSIAIQKRAKAVLITKGVITR
jgi:hypothetical protein